MRTIFAGYNPQSTAGWKFRLQDLLVDYDTRQIFVGKKEIDLTQTEYNIMAFLSVHAGKVLTYATIIQAVWGYISDKVSLLIIGFVLSVKGQCMET